MSTGNTSVFLDNFNRASKTWNGADDPLRRKFNAYSMSHYRYQSTGLELWSLVNGVWRQRGRTYYAALNPSLTSDFANFSAASYEAARVKANADLQRQIAGTSFNAGVQLGTLNQTLGSIVSLTRGVIASYRYMRVGNAYGAWKALVRGIGGAKHPSPRVLRKSRRAAKALVRSGPPLGTKDVSQLWLGLRYGWQPMMSDINDLVELLEDDFASATARAVGRGSSFGKVAERSGGTNIKKPGGYVRYDVRRAVSFTTDPSRYAKIGLTDPASVAWELLPFSFVLDWFLPVGDAIRNIAVLSSAGVSAVNCTNFIKMQAAVSNWYPYKTGYDPWSAGGDVYLNGFANDTTIRLDRYSVSVVEASKPDFFSLRKALSIGHLENAAALIHQLAHKG